MEDRIFISKHYITAARILPYLESAKNNNNTIIILNIVHPLAFGNQKREQLERYMYRDRQREVDLQKERGR